MRLVREASMNSPCRVVSNGESSGRKVRKEVGWWGGGGGVSFPVVSSLVMSLFCEQLWWEFRPPEEKKQQEFWDRMGLLKVVLYPSVCSGFCSGCR